MLVGEISVSEAVVALLIVSLVVGGIVAVTVAIMRIVRQRTRHRGGRAAPGVQVGRCSGL